MRISFLKYIGAKHRIAPVIAKHLHATGRKVLVDVFGGSGAITMNAGFKKRIYNDIDGDLVNLFKVMAEMEKEGIKPDSPKWTYNIKLFTASKRLYLDLRKIGNINPELLRRYVQTR